MDRFVFDYHHEMWTWKRLDARGATTGKSNQTFRYYLECVADAKLHGFQGRPYFMSPNGEVVSLSQPGQ